MPWADYFRNMTGIVDLMEAPNHVTYNMWGYAVWGILYVIIFITLTAYVQSREESEKEAVLASSLIMIPITASMVILEIIKDPSIVLIPIALTIVSLLVVMWKND